MIVIELSEDRFGKAMKNISCIEDKLKELKDVFEEEAMDYRKYDSQYEDEYRHYPYRRERKQKEYPKEFSRYI